MENENMIMNEEPVIEEAVATEESATEKLSRKCCEAKKACCDTIDRIARDLKETNYNPYIKQTRTLKVEIFRNAEEEEPIDVYETTDVKAYSAKALAVAGTAAMLLMCVTGCITKKLWK